MLKVLYSFRESSKFTVKVESYISDDEYTRLQLFLVDNPVAGDLIVGSGGLRKVRWASKGKGKRGGVRVIYYWADIRGYIFVLDIYAKNEKEDLSRDEIDSLRKEVENWLK